MSQTTGRPQHMGNTRFEDQRRKMEEAARLGHCTFCLEHLAKYHDAPILWHGNYWIVTNNDYPYQNTKHHLLLITIRHIEDMAELNPAEWVEYGKIIKMFVQMKRISGGAVFMRFGDENHSGGTLPHFHAHIIAPDLTAKDYQPIPCYVGAHRKTIAELLKAKPPFSEGKRTK